MHVGVRERDGVISVRVKGPKFVGAICSHTETHTCAQISRLPSLGEVHWNSHASVDTVPPCWVSLGLAVEATRVSIIIAPPNPVKAH